ncbi:hypothetical protein DERF_009161 [Dermatophagoides farinae]|uniref:Uncharacterized protein n=1 Tax=Dermatophagoides farinae TaxID=6954 RepID=A0A922HUC0_DERFA|nr:hypothetical protein DERF_009161 [Dermatophagoides farinae]
MIIISQLAAHAPAYCHLFLFRPRMSVRETSMFPTENSDSQLAAHAPAYCHLFLFRPRMSVRETSMFPTENSESAYN